MSISQEDRTELLRLAREGVRAAVAGGPRPKPARTDGLLGEQRGCFVTLTNRGRLRGCIGTFHPSKPLARQILEMAEAAAHDPRFVYNAITPAEVDHLTVGVSVLTPLEPIDDPLRIELGVHGIYVARGGSAGCFLPEVATETGWSKEQFLSHCCGDKAGMNPDDWRTGRAKVFVFTTEKFEESGKC